MIDIKFLRENPDLVKENIKKKFQDEKIVLVNEVIELDKELRAAQLRADNLRGDRNKLSKQIGGLMAQGKKDEAEQVKAQHHLIVCQIRQKTPDQRTAACVVRPGVVDLGF